MPRQDWPHDRNRDMRRDAEIAFGRDAPRQEDSRQDDLRPDDFGQVDYSSDYAYDPRTRSGYRAEDDLRPRGDDYGQADYSRDWIYDEGTGQGRRRVSGDPAYRADAARGEPRRSFMARAGEALRGRDEPREERYVEDRRTRRRGSSDRVLWAVIMERLEDDRRLDLRDVDVSVVDAEVTLSGTVRRKEDRRRIEDIADIDGVRHVQNNLRVRDDRGGWAFI